MTFSRKNAGFPAQRMGQTSPGAKLDAFNTPKPALSSPSSGWTCRIACNLVSHAQQGTGGGVRLFHIQLACACMLLLFLLGLGMRARLLHEWASHGFADEEEYSRSEQLLSLIGLVSPRRRHARSPCGEAEFHHKTLLLTPRPAMSGTGSHRGPRHDAAVCDLSCRGVQGVPTPACHSIEPSMHGQASLPPLTSVRCPQPPAPRRFMSEEGSRGRACLFFKTSA